MPAAIKLQREFAGELNTLLIDFVHSPGQVRQLGLSEGWFGTSAMWGFEIPFYPHTARPSFVLLSPSGEVVLEGSPIEKQAEIRRYVMGQRELRHKAPQDLPPELRPAWEDVVAGRLGRALKATQIVAKKRADQEIGQLVEKFSARVESWFEVALDRIELAIRDGRYAHARDQCGLLVVDGVESKACDRARRLLAKLDGAELQEETRAEQDLLQSLAKLHKKGVSDEGRQDLRRIASKFEGTLAARRASDWLKALN